LGSVSEMEAQIKNFALRTPTNNAQVSVGQTVQISLATLKIAYPKIRQINFKANGQSIGTTATRPYQMNWQPTQAGNFTLTAEAVLANGTIVVTPSINVVVGASQLEVLYDTLGNATTGWGWQSGYTSIFSNSLALNYIIVTCYLGTISSPKRLRGVECAVGGYNFESGTYLPPSYYLGRFYIGIWRTDVGTFYQSPLGGSLALLAPSTLGNPNTGSVSTPVGFDTGGGEMFPIYVIGWDNLDVLLPANVPIQVALYVEGIQLGDGFGISGSTFPGPNMLRASTDTGNQTIGQPMATRIKVSN
jgi:hypothetical protein